MESVLTVTPNSIKETQTEVKIEVELEAEPGENMLNLETQNNSNPTIIGSCENCGQTFQLRRCLLAHKFKCSGSQSTSRSRLQSKPKYSNNSQQQQQNQRKYFQCDQIPCTRIFAFKQALDAHKIGFHTKPVTCTLCPTICSNTITLTRHMREKHKLKRSSLGCPHCSTKFLEDKWLNRHLRLNKSSNPSICIHCKQNFDYTCGYKKHILQCTHAPLAIACPKPNCSRTYPTQQKLILHLKRVHPDPSIPNPPCPHCGKQYETPDSTRLHIRNVHGPKQPKKYACEYCFLKFSNSCKYRKHQEFTFGQTSDPTRLDCKQCGAESLFKCQAKYHIREQTCEKCTLVFTCEQVCSEHISSLCEQQREKWEYINCTGLSGYPCVRCVKVYPTFVSWRHHSYGHDDEDRGKEYHCSVQGCIKVFRRKELVRKHKERCHGDQQYICESCGIGLKSEERLRRHRKFTRCQNNGGNTELNRGVVTIHSKLPTGSGSQTIVERRSVTTIHPCPYCGHEFHKFRKNLVLHLNRMLPKIEGQKFTCADCQASFEARCMLKKHQTFRKCTRQSYKSEIINYNTQFQEHVDNCIDSDGIDLQNEEIPQIQMLVEKTPKTKAKGTPKTSKSKESVDYDALGLSCPHCQQKFAREISLQRHLELNRGSVSAGSCSNCDEQFEFKCQKVHHTCNCNQESSLTISSSRTVKIEPLYPYLETNHALDPGGPFWCWACKVSFNQKIIFLQHIRNVHNAETE